MQCLARVLLTLAATTMAFAVLAATPSCALADDPPPLDPTLSSSVGPIPEPGPAPADWWWNVLIPALATAFPDATYADLVLIAYAWFNVYPPSS